MGIHEGEIRRLESHLRATEERIRHLVQEDARHTEQEAEKKIEELKRIKH